MITKSSMLKSLALIVLMASATFAASSERSIVRWTSRLARSQLRSIARQMKNSQCLGPYFAQRQRALSIRATCRARRWSCSRFRLPAFRNFKLTYSSRLSKNKLVYTARFQVSKQCRQADEKAFIAYIRLLRSKIAACSSRAEYRFWRGIWVQVRTYVRRYRFRCGNLRVPAFRRPNKPGNQENSSGKIKDLVRIYTRRERELLRKLRSCTNRQVYERYVVEYRQIVEFIRSHHLDITCHETEIVTFEQHMTLYHQWTDEYIEKEKKLISELRMCKNKKRFLELQKEYKACVAFIKGHGIRWQTHESEVISWEHHIEHQTQVTTTYSRREHDLLIQLRGCSDPQEYRRLQHEYEIIVTYIREHHLEVNIHIEEAHYDFEHHQKILMRETQTWSQKEVALWKELQTCHDATRYAELRMEYIDCVDYIREHGLRVQIHLLQVDEFDVHMLREGRRYQNRIDRILGEMKRCRSQSRYRQLKTELEEVYATCQHEHVVVEHHQMPAFHGEVTYEFHPSAEIIHKYKSQVHECMVHLERPRSRAEYNLWRSRLESVTAHAQQDGVRLHPHIPEYQTMHYQVVEQPVDGFGQHMIVHMEHGH